MTDQITQKFRKLNEVEHVLARPGRYIGSIKQHTALEWVPDLVTGKMLQKQLTYSPGFLKLFDEVITNSADHSRTADGKHLDVIKVEVNQATGEISIYDNGGIPVVKHVEYGQWVPELIFELRAGTNFNDSDEADLAGQNGEGAALTCIFSEQFTVETCDGKNKFKMTFSDNSQTRPAPKVSTSSGKGYTKITYRPEFHRLDMPNGIDAGNFEMLYSRTMEIAATNTHLKVYFNGTKLPITSFRDYVKLFALPETDLVFDENDYFKVAVLKSNDGFQHTSFVSCTHTKIGGTHVTYVVNQIVEAVRAFVMKKHKLEIKPADVRNHLHLFIDCRIVNPRYSGQTKDELITEPSAYGKIDAKTNRGWSVPDKFIQKLLKTEIIQSILDWAAAKAQAAELAELRKLNKEASKTNPKRVEKFDDAVEKKDRHLCSLFMTEGDSARNSIQSARGKNPYIASFSLRGKPLSVYDAEIKDVINNVEFANILTITGLQLGTPVVDINQLRFGKIVILSDEDTDGYHVSSLLLSFFAKYWPELFNLGIICRMQTPLYIATTKTGQLHEFYSDIEFENWAKTAPKHKADRFKGLGGFDTETFERFLQRTEEYLVKINPLEKSDFQKLELAFSSSEADSRKEWLSGVNYFALEE